MTTLELRVLSGARSGEAVVVREERATFGRSPQATLRFDPEQDLEVSALHAEVVHRSGGWYLRDLDSRNGTWLDGARIEGERRLRPGSRVRLGPAGPEVEVREAGHGASSAPPTTASPRVGGTDPSTPSGRIRALSRRNRTLTHVLLGGLVLAVAAGAALAWAWTSREAAFRQERAALRADMDSLLLASGRAVDRLEGEMAGLVDALEESRAEVRSLRSSLDTAEETGGDGAHIDDLRRRLQAATVALTRHQLAASLDFAAIEEATRPAVALVFVELEPGRVSTATAFAVRPDGTLVTNRHVVRGADGIAEPLRIGVQFSDSPQVWPARVVRVSSLADLAVLRVDRILGDVPTVAGFNEREDTLATGSPVAVVGFPLGGSRPDTVGARTVPRALTSAGVIRTRDDSRLEIVGYGEQGASGSPVLDAAGRVVGVLYGGRDDDGTHVLLAVPATEVRRLLDGG